MRRSPGDEGLRPRALPPLQVEVSFALPDAAYDLTEELALVLPGCMMST